MTLRNEKLKTINDKRKKKPLARKRWWLFRFGRLKPLDFLLYNMFCCKNGRKTYHVFGKTPIFVPDKR